MFTAHHNHHATLGLLLSSTLLSGCISMGESPSGLIKITSDPAGALVIADGTEIGTTPMTMNPATHFRAGFVGFSYRYTGKLTLKKAGCDTWTTEVNDFILSKDVHGKMKCDPNYKPASAQPTDTMMPAAAPVGDATVERLERIETLRKKGLISEEEYRQTRARIIEKL